MVGSYALKGSVCPVISDDNGVIMEGCKTSRSGVEQYPVNCNP
jgi:hypothetical protein